MRPGRLIVPVRGLMVAAAAGALLAACSDHASPASKEITPQGGTVSTSDGTAVTIPAGALTQSTVITVGSEPNNISIDGSILVGPAYRFGPEGLQFSAPVLVTLAFDPSRLPMGATSSDIAIMTAPVGASSFTSLATTVVDATHVSASTTHFSDFVATVSATAPADQSMSLTDQGAVVDQSMSVADQGAPSPDLGPESDMTNACPHTWTAASCTLSASVSTCSSGTYSMNCAQTICFCSHLNTPKSCPKPSPYTGTTTCPPQDVAEMVWTGCCGYP